MDVLRRAGLGRRAMDVLSRGLDEDYVTADGTNLGRVRRPLPPDQGRPVRLLVPSWIRIASIKWTAAAPR